MKRPQRILCFFAVLSILLPVKSRAQDLSQFCPSDEGQESLLASETSCFGPILGRVKITFNTGEALKGYVFLDIRIDEETQFPKDLSVSGESVVFIRKIRETKIGVPKTHVNDYCARAFGMGKKPFVLWSDVKCLGLKDIRSIVLEKSPFNGITGDAIWAFEDEEFLAASKGVFATQGYDIECGGVGCSYELWSIRKDLGELELDHLNKSLGIEKYFSSEERTPKKVLGLKRLALKNGVLLRFDELVD